MSHITHAARSYESLMTAMGTILREPAGGGTFAGLGTASMTAVGTAACAVFWDGRPREVSYGGQVVSVVPWELKFPLGTNVLARDQVQTGGYTYEVTGTNAGATGALYLQTICVRFDG